MSSIRLMMALSILCWSMAGSGATDVGRIVPPDLARYFAGGGDISRGLPAGFPEFTLPDALGVIGAIDRTGEQRVLLRSRVPAQQGRQALVDALLATGWRVLPETQSNGPRTGFVLPDQSQPDPSGPLTLCHDDQGNMRLIARDTSASRVHVRRYGMPRAGIDRSSCAEQARRRNPGAASIDLFDPIAEQREALQYLPILRASPEFEDRSLPYRVDALRSGDLLERSTTITAPEWSAGQVRDHYGAQLRAQGWGLDAAWAGADSAGGAWLRSPNDLRLHATLRVLQGGAGQFYVLLQLQELE